MTRATATGLVLAWVSCFFASATLSCQTILINEFMASNAGVYADEYGEYDDWAELYNSGTTAVDIGGMYVTDKISNPTKWQIPNTDPTSTTIQAGGYLLLWFDKAPAQGVLHVDAKLSAGGEAIALFDTDGQTQIDGLDFGPQSTDISYGRWPDGSSSFQFFTSPTPGATNNSSTGTSPAAKPTASAQGGFKSAVQMVTLSSATPGATIRYTLNGSEPSSNSALYNEPLLIKQTTTLRAKAFAPDFTPSQIFTATYLFEPPHDFPVVALSFEDADFFDPATGIYPNFNENWERPVHVELFETDGLPGFSVDAVVEIHGSSSAELPEKSLKIKAKANGSSQTIPYPVFPNLPYEEYKSFLLRNSGQDWDITMFRDELAVSLVGDLDDTGGIIQPPKLNLQAFRPGLLFLNGQYWGIHNLREQITTSYIEQHFGLEESEMDFLENNTEARAGDFDAWNALTDFLNSNDFSGDAEFNVLAGAIDMPEFLDYHLLYILSDNPDWPTYNVRRFKKRVPGAKWHYLTYDFDQAFGLLDYQPEGSGWNTGNGSNNTLARTLDGTSLGWPNPVWATLPFRKAMENQGFRHAFINRTADFLNILFSAERMNKHIDEFEARYLPEMQRHYNFWNGGFNPWITNVGILRKFASERTGYMRQHVVAQFEEVSGTATVTLQAQPENGGTIFFSTITPQNSQLPWSGVYFTGVDIPAVAVPAQGYAFAGWSDPGMANSPTSAITLTGDETLTANFVQGSEATNSIVINEINYNSPDSLNSGDWVELYNPHNISVDISGWVFKDQSGNYFSLPANTILQSHAYLVLVEDALAFSAVYPFVNNYVGEFGIKTHGFKLSNNDELVVLQNAALQVIDYVHYYDADPWPEDADGGGASLQLINVQLDNTLPQSWKTEAPTPGLPNVPIVKQDQIINFTNIGNKQTTDAPFEIFATATSGLPVSFQVLSGPASLEGNTVTLNGMTGTVSVEATQAGSWEWNAAPQVVQSFDVTLPAPSEGIDLELTMSGAPATLTQFGNASFTATLINAGNEDAPGVEVYFPLPNGAVFSGGNGYEASQGSYTQFGDQVWAVGTVAAGTIQTITINLFVLENAALTGYAEVLQCGGPDADSTPGNGVCCTALEDDEAALTIPLPLPQNQSITFFAIPGKLTTDEPFGISASASSGLPVNLSVLSGPASLNGTTLTLNGTPGVVTIVASQPGNAIFLPAPDVQRSFTVSTPPQNLPDLELSVGSNVPVLTPFQSFSVRAMVTNTGILDAHEIRVAAPIPPNSHLVFDLKSKGTYDPIAGEWSFDGLAPGETATLELHLYALQFSTEFNWFAQVSAASPDDPDSSPGNNSTGQPAEDDEALLVLELANIPAPSIEGESDFTNSSSTAEFLATPPDGTAPVASDFGLSPNPASNFADIDLSPATGQSVQLRVLNEMGAVVKEYSLGKDHATSFRLDMAGLPAGYYIVRILPEGQEAQSLPFVKTRG